jgi:hypothetical protein
MRGNDSLLLIIAKQQLTNKKKPSILKMLGFLLLFRCGLALAPAALTLSL